MYIDDTPTNEEVNTFFAQLFGENAVRQLARITIVRSCSFLAAAAAQTTELRPAFLRQEVAIRN
jgi:hypothetical protein